MKLSGWKKLSNSVYERGTMRLHASGLLRLSDGSFISKYDSGQLDNVIRCTRLQGGNDHRGLMAWAEGFESQTI